MSLIPVRVFGLPFDQQSKSYVVLLQEIEGNRVLPIWIGLTEAHAIQMELDGKKYQRPLTHDLLLNLVGILNGKISKVVITDLKGQTFFANIYLDAGNGPVSVDARPSDSIAIALRARVPIFVVDRVLEQSARAGPSKESAADSEKSPEQKAEDLRRYLEEMNPEDFGKWNPEDL